MRPGSSKFKTLGQNVGRVLSRMQVVEADNTSSNSFTHTVIGQGIPALGELGVRNRGACNNSLIVTKYSGRTIKGNTIRTEGVTEIHDLLGGNAGSYKFTSIGDSFNLSLELRKPINWGLIKHVQDTANRAAGGEVM